MAGKVQERRLEAMQSWAVGMARQDHRLHVVVQHPMRHALEPLERIDMAALQRRERLVGDELDVAVSRVPKGCDEGKPEDPARRGSHPSPPAADPLARSRSAPPDPPAAAASASPHTRAGSSPCPCNRARRSPARARSLGSSPDAPPGSGLGCTRGTDRAWNLAAVVLLPSALPRSAGTCEPCSSTTPAPR